MICMPYTSTVLGFIRIPYTYIAFGFGLLLVFVKIGHLDEEIGWALGLAAGLLVLIANHFFPLGHLGLLLYGIAGFGLLTFYKIARDWSTPRGSEEDNDHSSGS